MTYVADHVQASKSGRAEHNSWWHRATTDQRLAQIDGGIECGMTARHVALACGLIDGKDVVHNFARRHDRSFPAENRVNQSQKGNTRHHKVNADRSAYLRGERVDLWGSAQGQDDFALDEVEA